MTLSLRRAKLKDHWRTALTRDYPVFLESLELTDGEVFGETQLRLAPGLNALVGKNGVGKSNFIRALYNCLSGNASNRKNFPHLIDNSKLKLNIFLKGEKFTLSISPFENEATEVEILCLIFDPCSLIPEIQKLFIEQDNLIELLEGFNAFQLPPDSLKLANYITNNEYESVEVISIEDEFEEYPLLPFFKVCRNDVCYDSRTMGLGELSLLYYFWIVDFIEKKDENCFLLIEEPESFVPPLIQKRLCDILARTMAMQGTACLVSTHSEHILHNIPRSQIHIMSRVRGELSFLNEGVDVKHMDILGLTAPKRGVLFFEDQAACIFIKTLIEASALLVTDSFLYHSSGSEGEILSDLKRFPNELSEFSFTAIFDGDCRERLQKALEKYQNYIFLPSNLSPEELIIGYFRQADIDVLSNRLGKTQEVIEAAKDNAAGLDHHDYFVAIARYLESNFEEVFRILCKLWVSDENNIDLVRDFLEAIERTAS